MTFIWNAQKPVDETTKKQTKAQTAVFTLQPEPTLVERVCAVVDARLGGRRSFLPA